MRKLKLDITPSLDSYIAGPNGEIDWLEAGGNADYGYEECYASMDTTLTGNTTYKLTHTRWGPPNMQSTSLLIEDLTIKTVAPSSPRPFLNLPKG